MQKALPAQQRGRQALVLRLVWGGVCSQAGSPGQCWLGPWHEADAPMSERGEGLHSQPQMTAVKS